MMKNVNAKKSYGEPKERLSGVSDLQIEQLRVLTKEHGLCAAAGDVQLLSGHWYITHSGLLRLARKNRCNGIHTEVVAELSDSGAARWVVKATVFKTRSSRGFIGYGDADPSNVSPIVRGAEMRVAETRAVNRALRKAYGIGLCSVEELGARPKSLKTPIDSGVNGGTGTGQRRLRDHLLLLIRQYALDASLVKRYAARFCGTTSLRDATREQVAAFIDHLASRAAADRDKLVYEMTEVNNGSKMVSEEPEHPREADDKEAA